MQKIRTRGNKWIVASATLLTLLQVTGAGLKWI
jgi:hypothetical protein